MKSPQHGFTLIELMVALTVAAILVGLAIPSFREFSGNSRTVATTNSLVGALAVARSEALRRSTSVSICPSTDMQTCNGGDWTQGWIVFTDSGNAGVVDGGDHVIQTWPAPGGNSAVNLNYAKTWLQYNARGMTSLTAAATFTTWVPHCRGQNQSQIVVTVAGSPQTTKINCP
jgi:type IV fimbrial biogenesis protein FimT